jgi:leucyl-tRNA synthetase
VWGLLDRHAAAIAGETRSPVPAELSAAARSLRRKVHQTIRRITDDVEERLKLNTAVSALIELEHAIADAEKTLSETPERPVFREALETLVLLLSPFAPHIAEEMWERLGRRFSIVDRPWPVADPGIAREDELELAVQVNGKVRGRITVSAEASEDEVKRKALDDPKVQEHTRGKEMVKVVVVPGRLVSVVVK